MYQFLFVLDAWCEYHLSINIAVITNNLLTKIKKGKMANRDIRAISCPPSGSTNGAGPLPPGVNMTKAKVKRTKNDWSWEDEMLMYDVTQRDAAKKKRRLEKEDGTDEIKKLKKQKEDEQLYQKEERKLFLGGLSQDTVEKDLRKHFIQCFPTILRDNWFQTFRS